MCNNVFEKRLKRFPPLSERLEDLGISSSLYSFSWFLCCFLYSVDVETCVLIWDAMIKEGDLTPMVGLALELMESMKEEIL